MFPVWSVTDGQPTAFFVWCLTHCGLNDWLADHALVQLRVQMHVGRQLRLDVGLPFEPFGRVFFAIVICVLGLGFLDGSSGGAERQEEGLLHPPNPDGPLPRSQLRTNPNRLMSENKVQSRRRREEGQNKSPCPPSPHHDGGKLNGLIDVLGGELDVTEVLCGAKRKLAVLVGLDEAFIVFEADNDSLQR